MEREAEDPHGQGLRGRSETLQLLRCQHTLKRVHQCRKSDGQLDVMGQPTQVPQRIRNTLQKMRLALIESAKSVGAESLHDPYIDVRVVVLHERVAIDRD